MWHVLLHFAMSEETAVPLLHPPPYPLRIFTSFHQNQKNCQWQYRITTPLTRGWLFFVILVLRGNSHFRFIEIKTLFYWHLLVIESQC